jgi:hypothetical protein
MSQELRSPCRNCPFSRTTEPGYLGGSPPETYIGQICGPFVLPCHAGHNYHDPVARRDPNNLQCAGAAIFRANVGVDGGMPAKLLHLPIDNNKVFGTFAEFLAHHRGLRVYQAEVLLAVQSPLEHLKREMNKAGVTIVK